MRLELSLDAASVLHDVATEYLATQTLERYLGRGMYGATCLALVANGPGDLVRFVVTAERRAGELRENDDPDALVDVEAGEQVQAFVDAVVEGDVGTRQDSYGRQTLYYWPNVTVQT